LRQSLKLAELLTESVRRLNLEGENASRDGAKSGHGSSSPALESAKPSRPSHSEVDCDALAGLQRGEIAAIQRPSFLGIKRDSQASPDNLPNIMEAPSQEASERDEASLRVSQEMLRHQIAQVREKFPKPAGIDEAEETVDIDSTHRGIELELDDLRGPDAEVLREAPHSTATGSTLVGL
jgi:hypothetical protein